MMRELLYLCAAAAIVSGAESLSRGERDRAMSELHATRKRFLNSIAGLSSAQWNFKPSPEAWSIGQIADHVVLTEGELFDQLQKKILAAPAQPARRGATKAKDEEVLRVFPDRTNKRQAPENLVPTGRWATEAAVTAEFKKRRAATISFADATKEDLRAHFTTNRVMGEIDAYQWLLLMSAHSERHVRQIEEVRANPKYPKK